MSDNDFWNQTIEAALDKPALQVELMVGDARFKLNVKETAGVTVADVLAKDHIVRMRVNAEGYDDSGSGGMIYSQRARFKLSFIELLDDVV